MRRCCWPICLALVALGSVARAQVPPPQVNPGIIQDDVDRQRRRIEQQQQVPKQQGPAIVGPQRPTGLTIPGGGERFLLRKVTFDDSKFITKEELNAIAAKYVGKQVDITGLQNLISEINQLYAQRGIVTAIATLPPQTATGGAVKIKLTEGRLQGIKVIGNQQTRESYLRRAVDHPVGEVLDVPKLNRDVVWFNRTNDVQMRALLQPGTDFGLTDLQLAITEPAVNTLQFFYDNQGVKTTGSNEGGIYYKMHGLAGFDDRFTVYGVKSKGNLNGNVAYNVPITPWGGRLGVSYTQGEIKIVDGQFATLDVTGQSRQAGLNFGQPLFVTDMWLVQANAAYVYGTSQSDFSAVTVSKSRYSKNTGGFSAALTGAEYAVSISPAFNSVNWHDEVLGGERSFNTFTGSANANWRFPAAFSATLLGSWQYTWEKLLPGDQLFSVGGPTTVRGYPTNAAAGDSGYYFNAEFHRDMSEIVKGLDLFVFTDSGSVYSTFPKTTQLDSAGVGASWSPVPALTFEGSVAFPGRVVVAGQPTQQFYGRVTFRPLLLL